jgi:hypothetical protein
VGRLTRSLGVAAVAFLGIGLALPSSAAATATTMTVPADPGPYPDSCSADVVTVTGYAHMTSISSGSKVEIQTNWQDTTGIGLTGRLYQPNDANHFYIMDVPQGQVTLGLHDSFELVSLDNTSNLLVHELLTITFVNGVPTDMKMQGNASCSGPTPP